MNGTIRSILMTDEQRYSLLVPRYLRGELSPDETSEFESYVDENPDFQADIEFQRNLIEARLDDNTPADMEFGWAKLSRSIDALETETAPLQEKAATPQTVFPVRNMWKIAATVLACLSIGQALYITNSEPPKYQLAIPKTAPGITLQVGFESGLSVNDLSRFLVNHESQIISGPGNLGIYTLSFSDIEHCESAISTLKSRERFVETYTSCQTDSEN